jgi:phosphatidylserine/phosphatidylglycerophosphate/cardiolipin synthase-like enzyme
VGLLGSANLNNRGMRDDTELTGEESMLTVARHLGRQRQRRSVDERAAGILQSLQETLGDPSVGLRLMIERAEDNLRRFKAKQPLVGHLLPYLTGEEAMQQGLDFHEEHGWVEVS